MRILIVVEAIPPYCGGAEQVAWIEAVALTKTDEIHVLTFDTESSSRIRDGVHVITLRRRPRQLLHHLTVGRRELQEIMSKVRPEVVHFHMPGVLAMCLPVGRANVVSTIHDGIPEDELRKVANLSWIQWLKFLVLRRFAIRKSTVLTCVSRANLAIMRRLYPNRADDFRFIPNPIYDAYLAPPANLAGEYILNFGRQIDLKMGTLIEVARQMPDVEFRFIGSGPMVRDYGLPNVRFLGFMESFIPLIDSAMACVFPSRSENFPLVGLEAMARGKPVIASRTGFGEYIEHELNGLLVDEPTTKAVAEAIHRLRGDGALRGRLGDAGRRTAMGYAPAVISEHYRQLYRELVADHDHKRSTVCG